jgi:hypothetical protein
MKNITKTINVVLIMAGIVFGTIQIQANAPAATDAAKSTYKLEKGYTDNPPRGKGFLSNILGKANIAHLEDADLSTKAVNSSIKTLLTALNTNKLSIAQMRKLCAYNVLQANFPSRGSGDIRAKYDRNGILGVLGPVPDEAAPQSIIRCWAYFPPVVRSKAAPIDCRGRLFSAGDECQKQTFNTKGDWYYADLPACQGEYTDYTIDKKTKEIIKEEQKPNSFDPKSIKSNWKLNYSCLSGLEAIENKKILYGTKFQQIVKNPLGAYTEAIANSSTIDPDSPLAKIGVVLQGLQKQKAEESAPAQ